MDMPSPVAGHRKLEALVGRWEGTETLYPSQWDPKGGEAQGVTTSRVALGGFALVSDYEQRRAGAVTFAGHAVYTFDAKSGDHTLHWFDSLGSPPEVFRGRFEGDVLTLGHGGPGMHMRMRWDLTTPGRLRSGMEMSEDGKAWKKLFDGEYRLVGEG